MTILECEKARCRKNEALVCTVGKDVAIGYSRFYLADLTDPLSITDREANFQHVRDRSAENGLHGNCKHRVTEGQKPSARDGTLCCIPGTVRGVTASSRSRGRRAGAIRQTLDCCAPIRCPCLVIQNPAWSLRGKERQ
ncbi:hypothetical protein [Paraburkholderia sediminicola]|uniref:hypothetical protein n=1 Tax=Paraburkholderia sediminicola TaxID=458836 RepID=UPI0038BC0EE5